jgi:Cft2 family RNA processing exonuclease
LQYFRPVHLEQTVQLSPEISFRFVRAAHILGSRGRPEATYLVHGEYAASGQLRQLIEKKLGWRVETAQYLEKVQVS